MTSQVSGELSRLKLAAWPTVRKEQAPRLTLSFDERADCVFIMTPSLFGHSVSRASGSGGFIPSVQSVMCVFLPRYTEESGALRLEDHLTAATRFSH